MQYVCLSAGIFLSVCLSVCWCVCLYMHVHMHMCMHVYRCGMSITLTSLTDLVAFLLGSTSTLPAVQYFCEYAAASIALIYAMHVTCYPALLALDQRRRAARRCDVLCCLVVPDGAPKHAEAGEATPVRAGLEVRGAKGRLLGLDGDYGGVGEGAGEGEGARQMNGQMHEEDTPPPKAWACEDAVGRDSPGRQGAKAAEAVKGELGFEGARHRVHMAGPPGVVTMAGCATPLGQEGAAAAGVSRSLL